MNYLDKFIVCFLAILVIGLSSAKITAGKEGSEKTSTTTENILSGSDSTNWLYNQPKDIASKSENLGYYFTIATCFIFITPVILLILRADFFDNGEFMLIAGCLQCRVLRLRYNQRYNTLNTSRA